MTKQQSGHSQSSPTLTEVARKYRVDDLPAAFIPGSRIANILKQIESGTPLSSYALEYLRKNDFVALFRYANNELSLTDFLKAAEPEQLKRHASAEAKALQDEKERQLKREAFLINMKLEQERAAARKRAYDNDPKNIARAKQKELRDRYGLSYYIEKEHFPRLMDILRRADGGIRLTQEDLVWLTAKHDDCDYFTEELRERYHENEAVFYACEFEKSKDPWSAVNASSHYRKSGQARTADTMLKTIIVSRLKDITLKSAIFTTHGGVKRDMRQFNEAIALGDKAHLLTPKDFRPCTLLGAVNIEIGNYSLGESWYKKAVERGANEKSVDDDLRSIFMRAESLKREELRAYLLKKDPIRYSWAKKEPMKKSKK
ncbi:MAG: hypothetical protein AB1461_15615 [Thermodesulfobacteriota bacterium]